MTVTVIVTILLVFHHFSIHAIPAPTILVKIHSKNDLYIICATYTELQFIVVNRTENSWNILNVFSGGRSFDDAMVFRFSRQFSNLSILYMQSHRVETSRTIVVDNPSIHWIAFDVYLYAIFVIGARHTVTIHVQI